MALRRIWGAGMAAGGAVLLLASPALAAGHSTAAAPQAPPAAAGSSAPSPAHDDNRGRVWLEDSDFDNGNEPRFECGDNIRILGARMDDSSGTWTVVSWSPTNNGFRRSGTWTYDQAGPTRQQIAVVGSDLPAGHYRLDVQQKNTKHKMFWVDGCAAAGAVSGGAGEQGEMQAESSSARQEGVNGGEAAPANATGEVAAANATGGAAPANATGGAAPANAAGEAAPANAAGGMPSGNVLGAMAAAATGGVMAAVATAQSAAQGGVLAATGTPVGMALLALGLIGLGGLVLVMRRRATF